MESSTLNQNNDSHEELKESQREIKKLVSTLPINKGWKVLIFAKYEGFWYIPALIEGIIAAQRHFKPEPTDIYLCTAPKSGTTWLKALGFTIVTRNEYNLAESGTSPILTKVPHDCVPNYEIQFFKNSIDRKNKKLPLIATHTSFSSLPKSTMDSGCKIVYLSRDPKDVFVSMWHYCEVTGTKPPIEEAFEEFCNGVTFCGPYWDHALEYWKASLENPDRILFLKYEDMKNDKMSHVKKLADFMGCPFSLEEEEKGVVQRIIDVCDFENLSNLEVNKNGEHYPIESIPIKNRIYFRKGEVGDWKNHLTPEMTTRLDKITQDKLNGTALTFNASKIA